MPSLLQDRAADVPQFQFGQFQFPMTTRQIAQRTAESVDRANRMLNILLAVSLVGIGIAVADRIYPFVVAKVESKPAATATSVNPVKQEPPSPPPMQLPTTPPANPIEKVGTTIQLKPQLTPVPPEPKPATKPLVPAPSRTPSDIPKVKPATESSKPTVLTPSKPVTTAAIPTVKPTPISHNFCPPAECRPVCLSSPCNPQNVCTRLAVVNRFFDRPFFRCGR